MDKQNAGVTPQNSVLSSANGLLNDILGIGQGAANVYSTYLGAKAQYKAFSSQNQVVDPYVSTYGSTLAADTVQTQSNATKLIIYGGIALAVLGAGALIWKSVK